MTNNTSNHKPKFSARLIAERFLLVQKWAEEALAFARELDWLGDAVQHPEGSEQRELALVRDKVDLELNRCCEHLGIASRCRAETTRSEDLLLGVLLQRRGDGWDALHLMERYYALFGDESEKEGYVGPETLPDLFAWDAYLRVSRLAELAERFPKQIRHSARQMHGWPMIVSQHLDGRRDFERLAGLIQLGADYPLDVGPRKRRGTETPMLRYLEPLVWRLHVLRNALIETEKTRGHEKFRRRLSSIWWDFPGVEPTAEVVEILKLVPALPALNRKTARAWSSKVIVPIILTEDAGTRETCRISALRNIWQHRSVKSRAIFRSRLHSAITDTLQRFGRSR